MLIGCSAAAVLALFVASTWSGEAASMDEALLRLRGQSERIALMSLRATTGDATAFSALERARVRAHDAAARLGEPAAAGDAATYAEAVRHWKALETHVEAMRAQRDRIAEAARIARAVNERGPALHDAAEQLAGTMARSNAGAGEIAAAQRLALLTERLGQSAALLLLAAQIEPELPASLRADADAIDDILRGLLDGGEPLRLAAQRNVEVRRQLGALRESFSAQRGAAAALLGQVPGLSAAKAAAAAAASSADALGDALDQALSGPAKRSAGRLAIVILASALALAALAALAAIILRGRSAGIQPMPRAENSGGLSVRDGSMMPGEVPPDSGVGSPAVEALDRRRLVKQIEDASDKVASAAERAAKLSAMAADAQRRIRDLERSAATIARALEAVDKISTRAEALAQTGRPAVEAIAQATHGARQALAQLHAAQTPSREHEQRMQRIAEYAKRMGGIAERMADFTKRANMVAINASIQSALSGQGVRVVNVLAEEFERLASFSAEVTKQIAAVVHTLQHDIDGLAPSVETLRHRGRLAEDAERALDRSAEAAKRLGAASDAMLADARAQRARLPALLEQRADPRPLAELAVQTELRGAELSLELAQVGAELERVAASLSAP